jgi:hypothetical protein
LENILLIFERRNMVIVLAESAASDPTAVGIPIFLLIAVILIIVINIVILRWLLRINDIVGLLKKAVALLETISTNIWELRGKDDNRNQIKTKCPSCHAMVIAPLSYHGQSIKCPKCNNPFTAAKFPGSK